MPPPRDDQYISISPTDSAGDDAGNEPAAAAPTNASHEASRQAGDGLIKLPAASDMPAPKSVGFQQFCDGLRTDLPGDSYGRGSFDTSTRFVAGDPGAKFGATAPLEYDTGRRSLNTYCVSVDTCWNFTRCMSWLTIVTWQSTNGKIPPCRTGLLLQDGGIVV